MGLLLILGLSRTGGAAVSDHLFWGQIAQARIYDDPDVAAPLYLFLLQVETDASVAYLEFVTPGGFVDVISSDEYTASGDIETYHWTYDSTHVWEYWGYFDDPGSLDFYNNGLYVIILHYLNGFTQQTAVVYGIPGTISPIPTPTQRPVLLWPRYDGAVASPVSFEWEPVADPSVADVYLNVVDADATYVIADVYDPRTTDSDFYGLTEGTYDIELMFENFYAITNADGIPFDLLKTSTLLQPFEVVASSVYRFWSPVTGRHFYTLDENEKDKLINNYSRFWTFEGPVFYAWSTEYSADLAPVYRFWSNTSGSHFYTISESEKNKLLNNYSYAWTYEGVAFYAYPPGAQPSDASPVYRFWNASDNSHFYTMDAGEVNKLITQFSHIYRFEGLAYYAYE
ncbi:MAG: hypothetical protein A2Y77_02610 [Planctomycetes bacterium RBG_13_62_9]|nr:MAG: hypothetical protein A2Y77_02610 [Planctomycetes bacterium RBG_13_62_9]